MNIKRSIKDSKHISQAAYAVRRIYFQAIQKIYSLKPIKKTHVLFSNFNGRGYGCNPKAISEQLHILRPEYKLLWVCSNTLAVESLPSYVTPVRFNSKEYFKALATSGTWVFNLTAQDYILKRKDQFYIQTWHGDRAFKKILKDAEELDSFKKWMRNVTLRENELCDCCMSASDFGTRIYRSSFLYNGWVLEVGQPRNDILIKHNPKIVSDIRENLHIPNESRILLYAPTFRDHLESQEKTDSNINLDIIVEELQNITGEKWIVFLRAHSGKKLLLSEGELNESFIDVTTYPDMADLLAVSDFLITDYSSCAPDFALTGRPILLYQDDIDDYVNKDRTMWFKMEESPYLYARNMDELLELLHELTPEKALKTDQEILEFYGTKESGESSRIICEEIIRRAESHN